MGMLLRHRPNENPQAVAPKKEDKAVEVKQVNAESIEEKEEKPARGRKRKPE